MLKLLLIALSSLILSACQFEANDTTPPVITLLGESSVDVNINIDPNIVQDYLTSSSAYVVSDNMPGEFTHTTPKIEDLNGETVSTIDLLVEGSYIVRYEVADESGNSSEAFREINVKDITPPELIIPVLHPTLPTPVPDDPTSILLPKNQIFKYDDLMMDVELRDVWYSVNGIPSLNPMPPEMGIDIVPKPIFIDNIQSGAQGFYFDYNGLYTATYTATDHNGNTSVKTRNIVVAEDTSAPIFLPTPLPLEHFPLDNTSETDYIPSNADMALLKIKLTKDDVAIVDSFYPYENFSSYVNEEDSDIVVTILEDSPIFTNNFTGENLTTSTPPGGVDIPMVVSDKSGNISSIFKRKLIIVDQEPPILVKFPIIPLVLELDATLTAEGIRNKIIELSSNPDDQDNLVLFADNEVINPSLIIESITDVNGTSIFGSDNSLNYNALSLLTPLKIVYTTTDGYNLPSASVEQRTRDLALQDTKPPVIDFNAGLMKNNFLSFLQTSSSATIERQKAHLANNGFLQLSDNGAIDFMDITLQAQVTDSNSTMCYLDPLQLPLPLDLRCSGVHTVRLSASDNSGNTSEYNQDVQIYIYDQASKSAFDEMVNIQQMDSAGNLITELAPGTWSNSDPYQLITLIENITRNQQFDSNNPQIISKFDVSNYINQIFTDTTSTTHNVSIDFSSTAGNYVNYYLDPNGEKNLTFSRPYPYTVDYNKSTLEPTVGEVTEIIRIKMQVGSYAELINLKVRISPLDNQDNTQHLIIPVFHKYTLSNNTEPTAYDFNSIQMEENTNVFFQNAVWGPSVFLSKNFSGLYSLSEIAQDVNNGIQAHGISALVLDNSYIFEDKKLVEYFLDSDGNIKKRYMTQITNHIKALSQNVQSLKDILSGDELLDPGLTDTISPRMLKISIMIIDPNLAKSEDNASAKKYFNLATKSQQHYFTLETVPADTCVESSYTYREPRNHIIFDWVCKNEGKHYIPSEVFSAPFGGKKAIDTASGDLYIAHTCSPTPNTPEVEPDDITVWWPFSLPITADCNGNSDESERNILDEFTYPSYIYSLPKFEDSTIADAIENPTTNISFKYTDSTISSSFITDVNHLTPGDYLSKFIFDKSIPKINFQPTLYNITTDTSPIISTRSFSPYTLAYEEEFSFSSAGFVNKIGVDGLLGSNPSNLSAYDKYITSPDQFIELSLQDMKDNSRIYTFNLNPQGELYNQQFLKINIWSGPSPDVGQNEYFLIEKRVRKDFDNISNITAISGSGSDPWQENENGFVIWHVEDELGATSVKREGEINSIFTSGFRLKPEPINPVSSTNTNDGLETGIVIKVVDQDTIKICHVTAGDNPNDDIYDPDCTAE